MGCCWGPLPAHHANGVTAAVYPTLNSSPGGGTITATDLPYINNISFFGVISDTYSFPRALRLQYQDNLRMYVGSWNMTNGSSPVAGAPPPFPGSRFHAYGASINLNTYRRFGLTGPSIPHCLPVSGRNLFTLAKVQYDASTDISNCRRFDWPGSVGLFPANLQNLPIQTYDPLCNGG